jgi:uncharacterized membrane protein
MRTRAPVPSLVLTALALGCGSGTERPPPGALDDDSAGLSALCADASFSEVVHPTLQRYCLQCHSNTWAGADFSVQSWSSIVVDGGISGDVVIPGDCGGSRLYQRVTGQTASPMPPVGYGSITDEEAACLCLWIESGCPDD